GGRSYGWCGSRATTVSPPSYPTSRRVSTAFAAARPPPTTTWRPALMTTSAILGNGDGPSLARSPAQRPACDQRAVAPAGSSARAADRTTRRRRDGTPIVGWATAETALRVTSTL